MTPFAPIPTPLAQAESPTEYQKGWLAGYQDGILTAEADARATTPPLEDADLIADDRALFGEEFLDDIPPDVAQAARVLLAHPQIIRILERGSYESGDSLERDLRTLENGGELSW